VPAHLYKKRLYLYTGTLSFTKRAFPFTIPWWCMCLKPPTSSWQTGASNAPLIKWTGGYKSMWGGGKLPQNQLNILSFYPRYNEISKHTIHASVPLRQRHMQACHLTPCYFCIYLYYIIHTSYRTFTCNLQLWHIFIIRALFSKNYPVLCPLFQRAKGSKCITCRKYIFTPSTFTFLIKSCFNLWKDVHNYKSFWIKG
jgi:hypothetical protein